RCFYSFLIPIPPPRSPLFPYTTLFRSFTGFGFCSTCHTCKFVVHSEIILKRDCCKSLCCSFHFHIFLCFNCLVQPIGITAAFHRSEEHTSELQSRENLVCRLLLEKKTA